ncbi:MAG: acetylxylan esterase [Armatimonadota bacterium]
MLTSDIQAETLIHPNYPIRDAIDQWCDGITADAAAQTITAQPVEAPLYDFKLGVRHHTKSCYLAFTTGAGEKFYGFWQPAIADGPYPLLIHLPGYGAEMSAHPELVVAGYNVLHINPIGYATPEGPDESKKKDDMWPVLPDVVRSFGVYGYRQWLTQVLLAIRWATAQPYVQPERLAIFGSSQGGGTALLTSSLLGATRVKAVAADVPFLTHFPMHVRKTNRGAYECAYAALESLPVERQPEGWHALGFIDTMNHAHRLTMPTLLTAGDIDEVCPIDSITALFESLPGTRSFTELKGQGHTYTAPFLRLAMAWFGMYV